MYWSRDDAKDYGPQWRNNLKSLYADSIYRFFFSVLLIIEMSNVLHTIIQRFRVHQERVGIVLQSKGLLRRWVSCIVPQSLSKAFLNLGRVAVCRVNNWHRCMIWIMLTLHVTKGSENDDFISKLWAQFFVLLNCQGLVGKIHYHKDTQLNGFPT